MFDGGELSASDSEYFITNFVNSNLLSSELINKKKRSNTNSPKKRFSDDQIRSLEVMFESESKLEPRKKLQLARELGLQPRQVTIWFQNKRARYKSKQLERDYNRLMANYDTLNSQFQALKKEKQSLILQLKKLHDLMDKSGEEGQQVEVIARNSSGSSKSDGKSENIGETELEGNWVVSSSSYSDEDERSITKAEYLGVDEEAATAALNGGSLITSNENWATHLESDGLVLLDPCTATNTTSSSYQWWDFWS